jgi:hypothetical protein
MKALGVMVIDIVGKEFDPKVQISSFFPTIFWNLSFLIFPF